MTALWVAIAGGLGSLARYGVGTTADRVLGWRFPFGTMTVNLLGSLLIGLAFALFEVRGELDSRARIVLTTGFLGGFTTYSAFAHDGLLLLERRATGLFVLYVGGTLAGALIGCWAGVKLGRALAS